MRALSLSLSLALFVSALPGLAAARCVTAEDLATGITFKRQDGRGGLVSGTPQSVKIDYAAPAKGSWTDKRTAQRGIYETAQDYFPSDVPYVGGGPGGDFTYSLSGKPPVPTAGKTWKTRVKVTMTKDYGTEAGPQKTYGALDAVYSFQPITEAKLSGCTYRIQPVEATFTNAINHYTQRWIYFPDLGFGLETRVTDHKAGTDTKLGLTALKLKG